MTNEKLYETAVDILRVYNPEAAETVIANPHAFEKTTLDPVLKNCAILLLDALNGMDRKVTSGTRLAALKRMVKSCCKRTPKVSLHGVFKFKEWEVLCDGCRAFRLRKMPDVLPRAVEAPEPLDMDRIMQHELGETCVLPSIAEVKAHIAAHKDYPMEALPDWWCDPQFLLDVLNVFPNGTAYKPKDNHSPLFVDGEDGDAILLPVRKRSAA